MDNRDDKKVDLYSYEKYSSIFIDLAEMKERLNRQENVIKTLDIIDINSRN